MNPFRVGDRLVVEFGHRQTFTVAALTGSRCAMRFPNLSFVRWYTVDDLLRWNPERAPKPAAAPVVSSGLALPAPLTPFERGHIRMHQKHLAAGDVLDADGRGLFIILRIEPVEGVVWTPGVLSIYYRAECLRLKTRERFTMRFHAGADYESVLGGPKITAAKNNPALVQQINPWPVWKGEAAS